MNRLLATSCATSWHWWHRDCRTHIRRSCGSGDITSRLRLLLLLLLLLLLHLLLLYNWLNHCSR